MCVMTYIAIGGDGKMRFLTRLLAVLILTLGTAMPGCCPRRGGAGCSGTDLVRLPRYVLRLQLHPRLVVASRLSPRLFPFSRPPIHVDRCGLRLRCAS